VTLCRGYHCIASQDMAIDCIALMPNSRSLGDLRLDYVWGCDFPANERRLLLRLAAYPTD